MSRLVGPVEFTNNYQAGRLCNASLITKLYNQSFCDTWGFVPMSTQEFSALFHTIVLLKHWDLNYLACLNGTPVGLLLTVPDLYEPQSPEQSKNQEFNNLRITVLGVLPSFRKRGIEASLVVNVLSDSLTKGYKNVEFSAILENNKTMINFINREFGVPVSRTFRIYEKEIIP